MNNFECNGTQNACGENKRRKTWSAPPPAHSYCLRPLKAANNKPLNRVRQLSAS